MDNNQKSSIYKFSCEDSDKFISKRLQELFMYVRMNISKASEKEIKTLNMPAISLQKIICFNLNFEYYIPGTKNLMLTQENP